MHKRRSGAFPEQRATTLSELGMGQQSFPTSAELDAVVLQMYRAGISYSEAVREFRKQFVLTVLRDANWNESKACAPQKPRQFVRWINAGSNSTNFLPFVKKPVPFCAKLLRDPAIP